MTHVLVWILIHRPNHLGKQIRGHWRWAPGRWLVWCRLQESSVSCGRKVLSISVFLFVCLFFHALKKKKKDFSKSSFWKITLSLGTKDSQREKFISRGSQIIDNIWLITKGSKRLSRRDKFCMWWIQKMLNKSEGYSPGYWGQNRKKEANNHFQN